MSRRRPCPGCGLEYKALRTGLRIQDVAAIARYSVDRDGNERRYVTMNTILGKWWSLKQNLWEQHLATCGAGVVDATDYVWRVYAHRTRASVVLTDADLADLGVSEGDELAVWIDDLEHVGRLMVGGKVVVVGERFDFPATWVRIRTKLSTPVALTTVADADPWAA